MHIRACVRACVYKEACHIVALGRTFVIGDDDESDCKPQCSDNETEKSRETTRL